LGRQCHEPIIIVATSFALEIASGRILSAAGKMHQPPTRLVRTEQLPACAARSRSHITYQALILSIVPESPQRASLPPSHCAYAMKAGYIQYIVSRIALLTATADSIQSHSCDGTDLRARNKMSRDACRLRSIGCSCFCRLLLTQHP
jgi:hypothetical protein